VLACRQSFSQTHTKLLLTKHVTSPSLRVAFEVGMSSASNALATIYPTYRKQPRLYHLHALAGPCRSPSSLSRDFNRAAYKTPQIPTKSSFLFPPLSCLHLTHLQPPTFSCLLFTTTSYTLHSSIQHFIHPSSPPSRLTFVPSPLHPRRRVQ
jgi:hypothetical protein